MSITRYTSHIAGVDLFRASLDFAGDESLLSADELLRADGLRVPQERRRYVAARALLRHVLAEQLGILPSEVVFAYGEYGKPGLARHTPTPIPSRREGGLFFNTSRSEDDWVCAVSRTGEVGVDVERVRDLPELDAMIRAYCTESEQRELALRAVGNAQSALTREFLRFWTRKEAALKLSGAGFSGEGHRADDIRLHTLVLLSASGAGEVVVSVAFSDRA